LLCEWLGGQKKAGANEHPMAFPRAGPRVAEPPAQAGCSLNSFSDDCLCV
jgi:hypothetical protein